MNRSPFWLAAAALVACQTSSILPRSNSMSSTTPRETVHELGVLDTFISYRETGTGSPIVFLHGNPTSSYVWRNVVPLVADRARCLAPDLVGMGRSGKPESAYRFPDRVRGVVVFETFLRTMHWSDWPPPGEELFRALRTPGVGEKLVLEENEFLARSLANGVKHGLADNDRAAYYAPYPDPASRRPMLQWPREIPIEGEPADVAAVITRNAEWLAKTPEVPKLLLTFDGTGLSNAPAVVEWARSAFPKLDVVLLGSAGHHAPEDAPKEIAGAITSWLDRHALR